MRLPLGRTECWVSLLAVTLCTIILCSSCITSNEDPVISSLQAEQDSVIPSSRCEIYCVASDADGDSLTYEWSATQGTFSELVGTDPATTWTAPRIPGTCVITVKVTDGRGGESTSSVNIKVAASNNRPIIEDLIVTPDEPQYMDQYSEGYRILKGRSCDLSCVALDPDDDHLNYEWSTDGGNIAGEGPVATWTAPLQAGEFTVTVTVTDSGNAVAKKSTVFKVETCPCAFNQ
jgi:hypothetical protein